jgi:ElaB/YqjD/DUF883 family membrane-anchored ribosome-binding protein
MTTMTRTKPLADQAAESAHNALRSTQGVANAAFDRMNDQVEVARDHAAPLIDRWSSQAESAVRRSVDAVRGTTDQLREQALKASEVTASRVRDEPLKAVLIAAVAGAALMALLGLFSKRVRQDAR